MEPLSCHKGVPHPIRVYKLCRGTIIPPLRTGAVVPLSVMLDIAKVHIFSIYASRWGGDYSRVSVTLVVSVHLLIALMTVLMDTPKVAPM